MKIDWQDIDDRLEELRNPGFIIRKKRNERIESIINEKNKKIGIYIVYDTFRKFFNF
jgi:hypothetical protein